MKKIKKRLCAIICVFMLFLQTCFVITSDAENLPNTNNNQITWNNKGEFPYISEITINDANGNDISKKDFSRDGMINIKFGFKIPNTDTISKGDLFTINIPKGFEIENDIVAKPFDEKSGIDMTWELSNNIMTIRSYENLDIISNVSGFISLECWFAKNSQLGNDGNPIEFNISGNSYIIDVYYDQITEATSAELSKSGKYDEETKQITWNVKVSPDTDTSTLAGVTVEDKFDTSKQSYVDGSFSINGNSLSDSDITWNSEGFEYKFSKDATAGTQKITYKTAVNDDYFLSDNTEIVNRAKTYMPNGNSSGYTEATVNVTKHKMQKTAVNYNAITHSLTWQIVANSDKINLRNAYIYDEYYVGKIDVNTITINGNKTTDIIIDEQKKTLKINLKDISDEVTIKYNIIIDNLSQLQQNEGKYVLYNDAKLFASDKIIDEAHGEAEIGIGSSDVEIKKQGKICKDTKYGQYIQWSITINPYDSFNYQEINDPIVIYDKIHDGQSLIPRNIVLQARFGDGDVRKLNLNIDDVYNSKTKELNYIINPNMQVGGRIVEPDCTYTLVLETSIDGVQEGEFTNTAKITIGNKTCETTGNVKLSYDKSKMLSKSGNYNYSNNLFVWNIKYNVHNVAMKNAVFTDSLPQNHIPAYDYIYAGGTKVHFGSKVNGIKAQYDSDNNTIKVSFDGYIIQQGYLYITTKYVGEKVDNFTSKNNIELKADNFGFSVKTSAVSEYNALPILTKKTNYTKGNTIPWEVIINLNHDNLGQLTLVDQLSRGLSLDVSSVKMYLGNVDTNGKISATSTIVDIGTIDYDNTTGLFTITLPENFNTHKTYVLKFNTEIKDKTVTDTNNTIVLKGTDFEESATSKTFELKTITSSSGIQGEAGSVRILKLDKQSNKPLANASFQLLDSKKQVIEEAGWVTTNSEGIAEFKDWLRLGTAYYIQEVRAPQGYLYDDELYYVNVESEDKDSVVEITIYNEVKGSNEKITISGQKTWMDNDNQDGLRPDSITVNLMSKNQKIASRKVTAKNNWTYEFENLDKYANGEEIVYTISEEIVEGYKVSYDGYNITNTRIPENIIDKPEDGEPEDGEPEDGEPENGEPENGEPEDGEPEDGEPENGEPEDGEPEDGEPEDGEPEDGEPEDGEPEDGEPENGEPENGEPEDGEPEKGEPEDGEPENGEPEDGEPEKGEPEDGEPENGEPEDGEPEDGEPEKGEPEDGEPENGEPEDGEPEKGEPEDGEPDDNITIPKTGDVIDVGVVISFIISIISAFALIITFKKRARK